MMPLYSITKMESFILKLAQEQAYIAGLFFLKERHLAII
jgi:hypothetical protein